MNQKEIQEKIIFLLEKYNFTILGNVFHFFDKKIDAFTGIVLLSESHFSIHTWPELGYISVDLFSCNIIKNQEYKIGDFFDEFKKTFLNGNTIINIQIINR